MAMSPKWSEKVRGILEINEEIMFVALQRNIESYRSFAALPMFLLLASSAQKTRGWDQRLKLMVPDTQLGALVAHVLEKATDRRAICDGVRVMSITTVYSMYPASPQKDVLFDSVVDGFAVVNSQTRRDSTARRDFGAFPG